MKNMMKTIGRILPAIALTTSIAASGLAQAAYPDQPIKMIVAYAPGGGTDIVARLMAQAIQKHLSPNASIVVVNRPGAGGGIGFSELANAKPDGYTIGFINTPNVLTIPIERKSNFHWHNYDLLGNVVDDPGNFSVHADTPIKNMSELIAFAKANPEKVTYGTKGVGSDDQLAVFIVESADGVKIIIVNFIFYLVVRF